MSEDKDVAPWSIGKTPVLHAEEDCSIQSGATTHFVRVWKRYKDVRKRYGGLFKRLGQE